MSSLRKTYSKIAGVEAAFLRKTTIDGVLRGDNKSNVDGSTTPVRFYIQPDPQELFDISQVSFTVSDGGNPGLEDYGSINGALTNGLQLFVEKDGIVYPFGAPIKSNIDLVELGASKLNRFVFASSTETSTYTFNTIELGASLDILLDGEKGDKFGVIIQDDLSALSSHNITIGAKKYIGDISNIS